MSPALPGPAPHCQPGAVSRGEYAPPANWHEIATTTLSSIGGRTCGDLLFSGHAAVATVTTLLLVRTQRPDAARVAASTYRRAWCYARCESGRGGARWHAACKAVGVAYVLVLCGFAIACRNHYTVDLALGTLIGALAFFRFQHGWARQAPPAHSKALA